MTKRIKSTQKMKQWPV